MKTDGYQHFNVLDILRGLAALSVFAHHFYQQFYLSSNLDSIYTPFFGHLGAWGVAIFFVLSGFCIHWGRLNEEQKQQGFNVKKFAIRRIFRIYPAFLVCMLICYWVEFFYTSNLLPKSSLSSIFKHLTLTSGFFLDDRVAVNNVFWSVIVECHFYIIYGFLWRYFNGITGVFKVVLLAIVISALTYLFSILFVPAGELRVLIQNLFITSWWTWCLGALVAELIFKGKPNFDSVLINRLFATICFLISIGIAYVPMLWNLQARRFMLPILAGLFLYFALKARLNNMQFKPLVFLGVVSYSLYLFHPLAILITYNLNLGNSFALVATFTLGLIFSYLSYTLVELRFILLGKSFLKTISSNR